MPVDIGEPDPAPVGTRVATGMTCVATGPTRAEDTAEHDAAIAADDDGKPIVVETGRDAIGE